MNPCVRSVNHHVQQSVDSVLLRFRCPVTRGSPHGLCARAPGTWMTGGVCAPHRRQTRLSGLSRNTKWYAKCLWPVYRCRSRSGPVGAASAANCVTEWDGDLVTGWYPAAGDPRFRGDDGYLRKWGCRVFTKIIGKRHSRESGNLLQTGITLITARAVPAEALFAAEAAPTGNPPFRPLICLLDAYQAKRLQCRFDQNYQ